MTWLLVPQVYILAIATVISAFLAITAWRRRESPVEDLFFKSMVAVTVWTCAYTFEAAAVEPSAKVFFTQIGYTGLVYLPPLMLMFVMEYAEHRRPSPYILVPAWILSSLTLLFAWTNPWHGWIWSGFSPGAAQENILIYHRGPWYWLAVSYYYVLFFLSFLILVRRFINSSTLDRRRVGIMILGFLFPVAGGIFYVFNLGPIPNLDWSALGCVGMNIVYAWNLFRIQMLDLVPVARGNIFENLDEGLIVLNTQAKIVDVNPAALSLFNLSNQEVIAKPITEIIPSLGPYINVTKPLDEIIQDDHIRAWLDLRVNPLYDKQDKLLGRLIIVHDITERKQAEERIKILSQALEYSPAPIVLMNCDGNIEFTNPSFSLLYGFSTEESLGQKPNDLLDSGIYSKDFYDEMWSTITVWGNWQGELCNRAKSGTLIWAFVTISPIKNEQSEISHFVAVHIDITENKKLIGKLEDAKMVAEAATLAKSEFLANMSHEIRTPMNAIIGMTSLLMDTKLNPEQHNFADVIRSSGDTLLNLINDILDFSKIEAGKLQLEYAPFDLRTCVEEAIDLVSMRAGEKKLELAYQIAPETPEFVAGDLSRLRQILVNLFSNAIKFTEKGEVFLSVSSEEILVVPDEENDQNESPFGIQKLNPLAPIHRLHFSVQDTGIGIAQDKMEYLFQSFTQLDTSTTRKYGGTGLGLSISKQLCEMMGGSIWVESEGIAGRGSTFHFTVVVEVRENRRTPLFGVERPLFDGRHVLIVDDNETNRTIIKHYIESWNMVPHLASSAAEALHFLAQWEGGGKELDLILVDMHMPDMDGIDLAHSIRKQSTYHTLPLIMITSLGYNQPDDISGLFTQCVNKPIKPSLLFDALAGALSGEQVVSRGRRKTDTQYNPDMARQHPLHLLLAEDNTINQQVITRQLERLGYRIDIAANGLEVLQSLRRQNYDAILMDVHMPEMDGLETTRRICEEWTAAERPRIIALTANAMAGDREICLAAGMNDYISKPVQIQELVRALKACKPIGLPGK